MARQNIELGTPPSGVGGDTPRSANLKVNANFSELYPLVGLGGVVDSGSNSNGSYVKYADGTMECWGISPNAVNINSAGGNVFHSATIGFNFAVAFSNVPSIVVSTITSSGYYSWAAFEGGASPSSFGCRAVSPSNTASAYLCYIARGRWK